MQVTTVILFSKQTPDSVVVQPYLQQDWRASIVSNHPSERSLCLEGDPKVGKVHFLKQVHSIQDTELEETEVLYVGAYQFAIYKELNNLRASVIFDEGNLDDVYPDHPDRHFLLNQEEVLKVFPAGVVPESPTDSQLQFFALYGAASIYAALNPDVAYLKTIDEEDNQQAFSFFQEESDRYHHIYDFREQKAFAEIQAYLKDNQASEVVLVYGLAHKFNNESLDLKTDNNPIIVAYSWPSLFELSSHKLSEKASLSNDPDEQLAIIQFAPEIYIKDFGLIKSSLARLEALSKLKVEFWEFADPAELEKFLLGDICDDFSSAYQEIIAKKRAQLEYPFSQFCLRPDFPLKLEQLPTLSRTEIAKLIATEKHAYTQFLIIQNACSITPKAFGYCFGPVNQLEALKKITDVSAQLSAEELKSILLGRTCFPEVSEEIDRIYRNKLSAFSFYD